jgi:hypothetical protein
MWKEYMNRKLRIINTSPVLIKITNGINPTHVASAN